MLPRNTFLRTSNKTPGITASNTLALIHEAFIAALFISLRQAMHRGIQSKAEAAETKTDQRCP